MDARHPQNPDHLPTVTPLYTSTAPSSHLERLDQARDRGQSFLWMGWISAFAWWVAAFGGSVALLGLDRLSQYSPAVIAAGSIALAIPGLMLLMAGLLARENARAASTNAVVLEAAARLLAPLESSGRDAQTFAEQMKKSAGEVDRSMAHALSAMKAMAGEISDERQKLETVSYVAADNAKELSGRLGDERKSLEDLASDIRKQTQMMSEAIPRQAAQMRDSARAAAHDIAQADQALEVRLENLHSASSKLTEKVSSLDHMSVEAARRSEELIFAVARMEEKLEQSRKMVEQALRAGEMVAASASTTGDRLTEAVNAALERAHAASRDIQGEALDASEKAARSLAALKTAGQEAAEAVRAARAEADQGLAPRQSAPARPPQPQPQAHAEPKPQPRPQARPEPRAEAAAATEDRADRSEKRESTGGWFGQGRRKAQEPQQRSGDALDVEGDLGPERDYIAPAETRRARDASRDEDLFDTGDDENGPGQASAEPASEETPRRDEPEAEAPARPRMEVAAVNENTETVEPEADETEPEQVDEQPPAVARESSDSSGPIPFFRRRSDRAPSWLKPVGGSHALKLAASEAVETEEEDEEAEEVEAAPEPKTATRVQNHDWSEIISDMERDEHPVLPREENAEEVIHRLMESGVRLGEIFRPRDKKRIANAARKGEGLRRKAILDAAARQVQRVQKRLDHDRQLMSMAREYLAIEEPDALMALDKTCHSSKNASPRLSAFLLLDAALG